ncbi:NADH peroxidase [Clostridium homopropionicum DSM 5847]|uniref:NADH peroxidase n=1 Tax=Clostridium homopropionicum DSM 5847 TaxID=1121318 RepID=A0A0L6ZB14_9CLOT|nr:FAD-dependent oxidoreductase [Clostridium homopropionicum]KOA20155.1 NADH peroxidase [Clostridium homopropionicum DSM 5847]SFG61071.1 NADPH-dependent 2,4-dienoyl-CoA reductase, sulfur reductase [Clostridium homopropionicum]
MIKTDILIIGGSAGGILTATTAKKVFTDKKVMLIRKTKTVMVPCGIPYIFGTLKDAGKNRIPDAMILNAGVELLIDEVVKIDKENKIASLAENEEISYDKLVIATGSLPIIPKFINGYDLNNVFPILKDEEYLNDILNKLVNMQNIVVIGGGFIGVEFAEQLKKDGKNVTIVEVAEKCLWQAFDNKICDIAEQEMKENNINVMTGIKVKNILGNEKVEEVELENGERIKADAVILGMGVVPNSNIAKEAGIKVNEKSAIVVDEYMRTSEKDIFAVGDCAEKTCLFTNKNIPILLASTAAMEAKVAACNLYGLKYLRENKGTISAFSTKIFNKSFGAAGLTERRAKEEGFEVIVGKFTTMDKHPGSLPGTNTLDLTLIFVRTSGVLIGAQISGGESVGEMINILSLAIQKGLTANELNTFQVATHPLLTSSPIAYPINAASLDALTKY